jgi:hypothetical protein
MGSTAVPELRYAAAHKLSDEVSAVHAPARRGDDRWCCSVGSASALYWTGCWSGRGAARLPAPQRDAVKVAFGLHTGDPPDRLLVALALLNLLSEMAAERPLLCLVDDAQWLDRASAQAVAFVARRLATEAVAFVFGAREVPDELRGLPEMVVEGLGDGDARALFGSVFPYRLDEPVLDRIVAETNGNPLALLELPRGLSPAQLAGGFGLPGPFSQSVVEGE